MKLATMTSRLSWRKRKPAVVKPAPTDSDRADAFAKIAEIESCRQEVDDLQAKANELKDKFDVVKAASDSAREKFAAARSAAWSLSCSLDSQKAKLEGVLLRSSSPMVAEFVSMLQELQRGLIGDGVRVAKQLDGKYTLDNKPHKSTVSSFASASARSRALVAARRSAEDLRLADLTDDELEGRLQAIFDSLPQLSYQACG